MDFRHGIRTRLANNIGVAAIVASRIYWVDRPQNSNLSAISLQVISDPRPSHLKGPDGARATRVQCDCWGATYQGAVALAEAAIAALEGPADVAGKKFGSTLVDAQRELGETIASGTFIHRQSVDFIIWHVGD